MYRVLVVLKVISFDALYEFESKAVEVMVSYNGKITGAFETVRNSDGSGEEIHLVEFDDEESFKGYRNDRWHLENKKLRDSAIDSTEIYLNPAVKLYPNAQ